MNRSKLRTHILILVLLIEVISQKINSQSAKPQFCENNSTTAVSNEDILANTFIYNSWITIPELMSKSHSNLRNSLIELMDEKCNDPLASVQALTDEDLAWSSLMYHFLKEKLERSVADLRNMSLDDYRNTIIVLNNQNTSYTISQLQSFTNAKNLNIAYNWWFANNSDFKQKFNTLNNVNANNPQFDKKDNRGINMHVMKVVLADEASYKYLCVYHYQISANNFMLTLAGSNDLARWTFINTLGNRSHQGDIKKWDNGYLVVNEQDVVEGSNNIRIRYYDSYQSLASNTALNDYTIDRTFSDYAEGTPDIRSVIGNSPESSHILIGFHYYDNGIKDQLATGVLYNFSNWRAWKNDISNNINQMGYDGNIGGRSSFFYNSTYVLQEAQITSNDWSSWRILLGDGAFYTSLSPVTPKGSVSFANPAIADIGSGHFAVTSLEIRKEKEENCFTMSISPKPLLTLKLKKTMKIYKFIQIKTLFIFPIQ